MEKKLTSSRKFLRVKFRLVNIERAKEKLNPLKLSNSLNHCAQIRAEEITKEFSHMRPSGYSCFIVIPNPYRRGWENIATVQNLRDVF